jgi:hypothetical protein
MTHQMTKCLKLPLQALRRWLLMAETYDLDEELEEKQSVIEQPKTQEKTNVQKNDKKDILTNIMNKRLDKAEKKSGVNVTVRTKKK